MNDLITALRNTSTGGSQSDGPGNLTTNIINGMAPAQQGDHRSSSGTHRLGGPSPRCALSFFAFFDVFKQMDHYGRNRQPHRDNVSPDHLGALVLFFNIIRPC